MTTPFRVLVTDFPWGNLDIERQLIEAAGGEVIAPEQTNESTLANLATTVDAIATCWARITAPVIAALPDRARIVARMGIGLDNIDIPAASQRGLLVTNVPDYCVEEVADHAFGLLLSLARNISWFDRQTRQQIYSLTSAPPMRRLSTQTCGLLGLGRIGRLMAERAIAHGMKVIAHTASGKNPGIDCDMVSLETLLKQSDYVSLHAPLTDETRHIINTKTLAIMKPTARIINTSRGGLIDHAALALAISAGNLAGAALDVFEPEPPDLSQPLFQLNGVVVTPHAAFVSEESLTELRRRSMQQVVDALSGRSPENVVNRHLLHN